MHRNPNTLRPVDHEQHGCDYITDSGWRITKRDGGGMFGIWWSVAGPDGQDYECDTLADVRDVIRDETDKRDFEAAHATGAHDDLSREGCPDCGRQRKR